MNTAQELKVYASLQKILYVEDDDILRNETIKMLDRFYMVVKYAQNGQEALELYKKENFDIVLTDIRMPKMDGIELSKAIRLLNRKQSIIVMSAHDDAEYLIELIKTGVEDFILKPADIDKFLYSLLQASEAVECKKELEKLQYKAIMAEILHKDTTKKCKSKLSNIAKTKVNANENVKKLVDDININKFAIKEFNSLNDELEDAIGKVLLDENELSSDDIKVLISIFEEYKEIFTKYNMDTIATTISKMDNVLSLVDVTNPTHKDGLQVLNFIYEDFMKFINKVFIEQSLDDLAYFNDTIEASINEFEIKLGFKNETSHIGMF